MKKYRTMKKYRHEVIGDGILIPREVKRVEINPLLDYGRMIAEIKRFGAPVHGLDGMPLTQAEIRAWTGVNATRLAEIKRQEKALAADSPSMSTPEIFQAQGQIDRAYSTLVAVKSTKEKL